MAANYITIIYCLLSVVIALLIHGGNAAGDLYEHTFTMKLPLMKPGEVLFTLPGFGNPISFLEMPRGHIAIKRCDALFLSF